MTSVPPCKHDFFPKKSCSWPIVHEYQIDPRLVHNFTSQTLLLFSPFPGSFYTRFASEIESDPVGEYDRAKACLAELGMEPETITDEDCSALR